MKTVSELLKKAFRATTDELYVQLPAEITKVSSDGNYVSAILRINDNEPDIEVHHIRVRHLESQQAYIYLGMKKGDFGVVRFFDRSTEAYLQSDFDYNSDDRQHDINDRCFELGFIPDAEAYVYPENQEIEIGLKNGNAKISIDPSGNINIYSVDNITVKSGVGITLDSPDVTTTGNLSAGNGKSGMYATNSGVLTFSNGILTASS